MAEAARRRGHHEDSTYFDASKNRWVGATSLGFSPDGGRRIRQKVRGRTKAEVRDKLQALHRELEVGLRVSASYTVASCLRDWLTDGLTTLQPNTLDNYRRLASHVIGKLGAVKLKDLTARQVQKALALIRSRPQRGRSGYQVSIASAHQRAPGRPCRRAHRVSTAIS